MENKEFKYTYSAPNAEEKKEIQKIQSQYLPKEREQKEDKMTLLKKLDAKVKAPAKAVASVIGVIGFCCFGLGMSMVLEWNIILWGAIVGVVGLILMAFAYPIFNRIFASRKEKYASKILELSGELLGKEKQGNVSIDIKE